MPDYVVLMRLTESGSSDLFNVGDFVKHVLSDWKSNCGPVASFRMTMGDYDFILLGEAPDDERVAAFSLYVCQQGKAKTTTMRAFRDRDVKRLVSEAIKLSPRAVPDEPRPKHKR